MFKKTCLSVISAFILVFAFNSCGTTEVVHIDTEITKPVSPKVEETSATQNSKPTTANTSDANKKPSVSSSSTTATAFGYVELKLLNYNRSDFNKTYKANLRLTMGNQTNSSETYILYTDSNGFFYKTNLKKFSTYIIKKVEFAPNPDFPDSYWTFTINRPFSIGAFDVESFGDILITWDCAGSSSVKNASSRAPALYEKVFRTRYQAPVYAGPSSFEIAESYKNKTPDPRIVAITENSDYEKLRIRNPEQYIKQTSMLIEKWSNNEFDKARLAHDLVALVLTYDGDSYWSGRIPNQSYENVLSTGKSVCAGYASVYKRYCDELKLGCVVVAGFAKGVGFNPSSLSYKTNHDWNLVMVEGDWYLVDCTWDSGYMNGRTVVNEYTTEYLFVRPEYMIYSHYPEKPEYQLLSKKFSDNDIIFVPNFKPKYLDGTDKFQIRVDLVDSVSKKITLTFLHSNNQKIEFNLLDKNGYDRTDLYTAVETVEGTRVFISAAEKGLYDLAFNLRVKNERGGWTTWTYKNFFSINCN